MANVMSATLGLFKSMLDTARAIKDMNDAVIRNAAVIELQEKILAAQHQQTSLIEYVTALEQKVDSYETWSFEKQRYELKPLGTGVAYTLKAEAQASEPPHHLCANCFARDKKSFLARVPDNIARQHLGMGATYRCSECKAEI